VKDIRYPSDFRFMINFISQKEYDGFVKKLAGFEEERGKLQKMLGKIMETSGSFASKTPGFNETEDQVKIFNKKISDLKNFLAQARIVKNLSELDQNEATIYSLITCLDINSNKEIKYYIQHDPSEQKKDYKIITPSSPVATHLIGKKINDKIKLELPKGILELKIISIEKII